MGCSAQVPESKDQVIKPERVLVLSKSMRVRWRDLGARMHRPGVTSLDDIMRIDLHYIMRCAVLSFLVLWLACPFGQLQWWDAAAAAAAAAAAGASMQTFKSGAHQH